MIIAPDSLLTFSGASQLGDCNTLSLDQTLTLALERDGNDGYGTYYVELLFASSVVSVLYFHSIIYPYTVPKERHNA